jgi:V/A-type H+/Na+-transporting ATPase subunit B
MFNSLLRFTKVLSIVGDVLTIRADDVGLGDLAVVENGYGESSLAQIVEIQRDRVSLQVFSGGKGLSTDARVHFLGHSVQVNFSPNVLGRVFDGVGEPVDGGPRLQDDRRVDAGGPSVNPTLRIVPKRFIETKVPMIDVFNCLVESQKIPIFSIAGEPYNKLLARIGIQADAEIIVFCGMGLIFDDFHFFRSTFENEGLFSQDGDVRQPGLRSDRRAAVGAGFGVESG